MDCPELSIVFSHALTQHQWFAPLRVMLDEANICEVAIEDTLSELVYWRSTSEDFVEDQVALILDLGAFSAIVRNLQQEIASWPDKLGRKFVTLVVMLKDKEKISLDMERKIVSAQLDSLFNVQAVHGVNELFHLLACISKATAKKYSHRLRGEVLGFDENRRTAANPADVWPGVLEMFFSRAAGPLSRAIAARYATPVALRDELLRRPAVEVFEGITATVGEPPLQRTFKIGPETANRLYHFFTQDDASLLI